MAGKSRYAALDIAHYFIHLAERDPAQMNPITPLKLQKLVYYAQGYSLARRGEPIFSESFVAWPHGPVVVSVYRNFEHLGGDPIPPLAGFDAEALDRATIGILKEVYRHYGRSSATELSALTHTEWPWQRTPPMEPIANHLITANFVRILKLPAIAPGESFTPSEREWVLDSVLASQAMEGIAISREEAERLLDDLDGQPLPSIGQLP